MLRNVVWNLLGDGLPLVAAVLSIPILVHTIGLERFSALTLIWALLGYLSLLDFGLSRALTQQTAALIGAGRRDEIARTLLSPLLIMGAGGLVAMVAVFLLSDWLAHRLPQTSSLSVAEIRTSLRVVALMVPVALLTSGFRGILEGHQRFDLVNMVKLPVGVLNYLSPLAILPFTDSLVGVVVAVVVGRSAGLIAYAVLALRLLPLSMRSLAMHGAGFRRVFVMGGWMTVSNVISPLMTYADRFIMALFVPIGAVAYYTTPFEVMVRLLFVPGALSGVLFPTLAAADPNLPQRQARLLESGIAATTMFFVPVLVLLLLAGPPVLALWLGEDFAGKSGPVMAVLALGVFFNALTFIPFAAIQGAGRADLTAKMHLCELPLYLGVLYLLVSSYGIMGAAAAWTLRTGCDLLIITAIMARLTGHRRPTLRLVGTAAAITAACAAAALTGGWAGAAVLVLGSLGIAATAWDHFRQIARPAATQPHWETGREGRTFATPRDVEPPRAA